jgi:hypothetical protein
MSCLLRRRLARAAIIGVALLLAGCSALRLAYSGAPQFTWWWLDGQFDFASEQTPQVKDAIERWFTWHRQTQLPEYVAWLEALDRRAAEPVDAVQVCAIYGDARQRLQPAIDQALERAADLVPVLTLAQVTHFEAGLAKSTAELRREYAQPDTVERRRAALKRQVERYERFYGKLDEPMRRIVEAGVTASPFDSTLWIADRERRQRDMTQSLRRWLAERPDRAVVVREMRELAGRMEASADPTYRSIQQRSREHNCRIAAAVHNAASPTQRESLRRQLRAWQGDLKSLASPG